MRTNLHRARGGSLVTVAGERVVCCNAEKDGPFQATTLASFRTTRAAVIE
jgi:hypothetical protein